MTHPVSSIVDSQGYQLSGGCYNVGTASGCSMCREVRRGACVWHAEGVRAKRAGAGEAERRSERRGVRDLVSACTPNSDTTVADSCNTCEAPIGGTAYCSKCNEPDTYAPVDRACVDARNAPSNTLCTAHTDGACTECGSTSFLYKGGCYQPGDGKPGQSLCILAAKGVCTQAADGYFVPKGAANNEQSVVACNDETGVSVGGSTYKGIANCQECAAPDAAPGARADKVAVCTRCQEQKYLKGNACVDSADDCGEGQFGKPDPDSGNRCVPCTDQTEGVTNCETCEYNTAASKIRCTKCTGDNYLKTVNDVTTCVTECDEGYFGHTAATGGLKTCQSCSGENAGLTPAGAGVDGCAVCTYASNKVTCTKCEAGKYLKTTSDSTTCVEASGCGPSAFLKDDAGTENKYMPYGEAGSGGIADCAECSLFPYK